MDKNMQTIMQKRIERTMEALRRSRMEACYAERAADVPGLVESLLREGDTVIVVSTRKGMNDLQDIFHPEEMPQ